MAGLLEEQMNSLPGEKVGQIKEGYQIAKNMIFDEEVFSGLMADAQQSSPVEAVSMAVVMILDAVEQQMGGRLDLQVVLGIGMAIFGEIVDAMQQIGMQIGEEESTAAFEQAVTMYLSKNTDKHPQEEVLSMLTPEEQAMMQGG